MKSALVFVVVASLCFACFALGWNGGRDMEHARMTGASEFPAQPMTPAPQLRREDLPGASASDIHGVKRFETYFSPRGGCTQAICDEINKAQRSILIQAYGFTSEPIGGALVGALKRGVKVTASLDAKSNRDEGKTIADMIAAAGAEVRLDGKHPIAHSKVMVIDGATVITGSFNFTNAAEHSNLENLAVVEWPQLAERYRENFEQHWEHAEPYALEAVPVKSMPRR